VVEELPVQQIGLEAFTLCLVFYFVTYCGFSVVGVTRAAAKQALKP
jgi:hypothetical protein